MSSAVSPFLTSERIAFRLWRPEDLEIAIALWGDPVVTRLIARQPLDRAAVEARLQLEIEQQHQHGIAYWPIFLRSDGTAVGCCGLRPYNPDSDTDVLELGFHLRPPFWGRGLAGEAATTVCRHAFEELRAGALFAGHHPDNASSRKLLGKLGFRHTHDEHYPPTGLQHPSYLLSHEEWRKHAGH